MKTIGLQCGLVRVHRCLGRQWFALLLLCLTYTPVSAQPDAIPPASAMAQLLETYQQSAARLNNPRYVALVNYRQPSWEPRFYLIDPNQARVIAAYHVAHGQGSDPDHDGFAEHFSDRPGSHMSSLGYFVTREAYISPQAGHGLSLRLEGLSASNQHAYDRQIVIHANHYMEQDFIEKYGRPGRSHGCLTFTQADRDEVVARLARGALIYAIH